MSMDPQSVAKLLNTAGLTVNLAGAFLLSVEALRVARVARVATLLEVFTKRVSDPTGWRGPLPLTWTSAILLTAMCVVTWFWIPVLTVFTVAPAFFVVSFLLYRFTRWASHVTEDAYVAIVGFLLLCIGTGLQLAAAIAQ